MWINYLFLEHFSFSCGWTFKTTATAETITYSKLTMDKQGKSSKLSGKPTRSGKPPRPGNPPKSGKPTRPGKPARPGLSSSTGVYTSPYNGIFTVTWSAVAYNQKGIVT